MHTVEQGNSDLLLRAKRVRLIGRKLSNATADRADSQKSVNSDII
jgi:hypothetical protein